MSYHSTTILLHCDNDAQSTIGLSLIFESHYEAVSRRDLHIMWKRIRKECLREYRRKLGLPHQCGYLYSIFLLVLYTRLNRSKLHDISFSCFWYLCINCVCSTLWSASRSPPLPSISRSSLTVSNIMVITLLRRSKRDCWFFSRMRMYESSKLL